MDKLHIGKNEWIEWKTIIIKTNEAREIDEILNPTKGFWKNIEYNCNAECCGIMAFSFLEKDIWSASLSLNIAELIKNFEKIILKISEIEEQILRSNLINDHMDKHSFQNLLAHILNVLKILSLGNINSNP